MPGVRTRRRDRLRESAEVCNANGACVATQCTTSADCTDRRRELHQSGLRPEFARRTLTARVRAAVRTGIRRRLCWSAMRLAVHDGNAPSRRNDERVPRMSNQHRCGSQVCEPRQVLRRARRARVLGGDAVCDSTTNMSRLHRWFGVPERRMPRRERSCCDETDSPIRDGIGHDVETCTKAAPCGTIAYTISQASGDANRFTSRRCIQRRIRGRSRIVLRRLTPRTRW